MSVLVLLSALLTSKGPEGETAKEICEAIVGVEKRETCSNLNYPNIEQMLGRIRTGVADSRTEGGDKILSLSNAIFLQKGLHVHPNFLTGFTRTGINHVEETLFNTSEAFEKINEWARSSTDGLIERFLRSKDELSSDTLMILLNAIAFKENWAKTFMVERTMKRNFYLKEDAFVEVPMMHLESQMVYLKNDKYRVVAKPFRNDRFKFLIFLPNNRFNLDEIEDDL
ncbi:unnamed protein product, partial [Hydatigera taeniaeformis]